MKALGIPIETMEILKDSSGPININEMRAIKERETAYLKRLERGLAEGSLVEIDEVLKKLEQGNTIRDDKDYYFGSAFFYGKELLHIIQFIKLLKEI